MIAKGSEVSNSGSTIVPKHKVGHQLVLRRRSACRHGAERSVLGPIQERGAQHKRVSSIEVNIEVISNASALSDGNVDRRRHIRHRGKSSRGLFRELSLPAQPNTTQRTSDGRRISARLTYKRWPSVKCHTRQQGAVWIVGSFLFSLPSRRAHAAIQRRRSPSAAAAAAVARAVATRLRVARELGGYASCAAVGVVLGV